MQGLSAERCGHVFVIMCPLSAHDFMSSLSFVSLGLKDYYYVLPICNSASIDEMLDFQSRPFQLLAFVQSIRMSALRLVSVLVVLHVSSNQAFRLEFSAQSAQLKVKKPSTF